MNLWCICFLLYFFNFVHSDGENDLMTTRVEILETQHFVYWPNGTIPFYINPDHFDSEQAMIIMTTLSLIAFKSCLKFSPVMVAPGDTEHVLTFVNPTGVRKCDLVQPGHPRFEPHVLNIGYDCLVTPWIDRVVLRALGLPFEHNRDVRDLYVDVQYENIEQNAIPLFTKNFKLPAALRALPYDINSVLHFGDRDYSKNGHRTLIFKERGCEQKHDGPSDLDLRKIEIIYGPECRERDRQEKIELCHLYPGVPPPDRRKRSIDIETSRSLRFNRDITAPPFENHMLKLNLTNEDRDKFKSLNIDDEAQNVVDAAYKLTVKALNTARGKHCNESKNDLTAADNKDILGVLQMVAEFAISIVNHATLNQTSFCEESQAVERYHNYHEARGEHMREIQTSSTDKPVTNPESQTVNTDGRKSVASPQFRVNDDENDDAMDGNKGNDRADRVSNDGVKRRLDARDRKKKRKQQPVSSSEEKYHEDGDERELTNSAMKIMNDFSKKGFNSDPEEREDGSSEKTDEERTIKSASEKNKDSIENKENQDESKGVDSFRGVTIKWQSSVEEDIEDKSTSVKRGGVRTIKSAYEKLKKRFSIESKDSEDEPKFVDSVGGKTMKSANEKSKTRFSIESKHSEVEPTGDEREEGRKIKWTSHEEEDIKDESRSINGERGKTLNTNEKSKNSDKESEDSEEKPTGVKREARIQKPSEKSQKKGYKYSDNSEDESTGIDSFAPRTIELSKPTQSFYNDRMWPSGVVKYVINQDCTDFDVEDLRYRLSQVNAILRKRTCTRIEEIRWNDVNKYKDEGYLVLDNSDDYVTGRVGGEQIFGSPELLSGGQHRQHAAMMVMAMLGFYFEPARHDRDQYVRVHLRHVAPGKLHHFEKLDPEATLAMPYDYKSATHPPWNFWRKPKKGISTVTTYKDNDPKGEIMRSLGQHKQLLSEGDIVKINSVYGLKCMKSARRI